MEDYNTIIRNIWLAGISLLAASVIISIALLKLRKKARKLEQDMLIQFGFARVIHSLMIFGLTTNFEVITFGVHVCLTILYRHADIVSLCWHTVFTRSLYERLKHIFIVRESNFRNLSLIIWLSSGLLTTLLIALFLYFSLEKRTNFSYTMLFFIIKSVITWVNLVFFGQIFAHMIKTKLGKSKCYTLKQCDVDDTSFGNMTKITIVSLLLSIVTRLYSDTYSIVTALYPRLFIESYFISMEQMVQFSLAILDVLQAVIITVLSFMLSRNCESRIDVF